MKKEFKIILISVVVLALLFGIILLLGANRAIKLNKVQDIKEDKIKLTVLESEKATINKEALELNGYTMENSSNGDYIKVKVTIENYGSETYRMSATTFYLGKKPIALLTMSEDDFIAQEIKPNETVSGYIYFEVNDSNTMTYYTHMEAVSSDSAKGAKYIFKIK